MKKLYKFTVLLVMVAMFLQVSSIFVSNKLATDNINATTLRKKISKLKQDNVLLSAEILKFASFEQISKRANELGFEESRNAILLFDSPQVAVR